MGRLIPVDRLRRCGRRGRGLGTNRAARGRFPSPVRASETPLRAGAASDLARRTSPPSTRLPTATGCRLCPYRGRSTPANGVASGKSAWFPRSSRTRFFVTSVSPSAARRGSASTAGGCGSGSGPRRWARSRVHRASAREPGDVDELPGIRIYTVRVRGPEAVAAFESEEFDPGKAIAAGPKSHLGLRGRRGLLGVRADPSRTRSPRRSRARSAPVSRRGRVGEVRSLTRSVGLRDRVKGNGFLTVLVAPRAADRGRAAAGRAGRARWGRLDRVRA